MTFWTKRLVTLSFLLILVNCTGYRKVYVNYDRSVDFVGYNTFAWTPDSSTVTGDDIEKPVYDTDIVRNNAKNYITHSLSQRGYLVNIDSPDVVLQLVLLNEEKERIVTRYGNLYSGYYHKQSTKKSLKSNNRNIRAKWYEQENHRSLPVNRITQIFGYWDSIFLLPEKSYHWKKSIPIISTTDNST